MSLSKHSHLYLTLCLALVLWSQLSLAATINVKCGKSKDLSTISMTDKFKIQTPRYRRRNYPNNYDCSWTFSLGDTCTEMKINCDKRFRIAGDPNNDCDGDYLEIDDGSTATKYCGTQRPNIVTTANTVDIQFLSDASTRDRGMRCFVRCTKQVAPPSSGCACGKVNRVARIVGGQQTEVNEYPWQVALVTTGSRKPWCGGTLVNKKWVLTAAHCMEGETSSSFQVILGEHNWQTTTETTEFRHNVQRFINHPNYDDNTEENDFALVELVQAVDYSNSNYDHVRPACFPSMVIPVGVDAIASGWGDLESGGSQPNSLQEVVLPTLSNSVCQAQFNSATITNNMLCAGDLAGGIDTCQGDSGGPLVWQNNNSFEIHGVTSWGYGCGDPNSPGVYARVFAQWNWISSIIGDDSTCPRNDAIPVVAE